jgi:hypothetical protein
MTEDQQERIEASSEEKKSGSSSSHLWAALMMMVVVIPVLYVLSPFVLLIPIMTMGRAFPRWAIAVLEVFWAPLGWYTESGLPGGKEYLQLIEWFGRLFTP